MSTAFVPQLDTTLPEGKCDRANEPFLESWLSEVSDISYCTPAGPLVAVTITPETIQNLLHSYGYPVEAAKTDSVSGPFEDTQFDLVVDVQTSSEESNFYSDDSEPFKSSDFDDAINCSSDDISEDEFSMLTDYVLSPSSSSFSENDLNGSDSGIEEMEELLDGKDVCTKRAKQDEEKPAHKTQTSDASQPGPPTSVSNHSSQSANKLSQMKKKRHENKPHKQPSDDVLDFHCQFLWEFLHHLLADKKYSNIITWRNQTKGIFRLLDHNSVARLWGAQKKRKNMTYDKLSRALRYYYSKNILRKVDGQRLTYKFVKNLSGKKYP